MLSGPPHITGVDEIVRRVGGAGKSRIGISGFRPIIACASRKGPMRDGPYGPPDASVRTLSGRRWAFRIETQCRGCCRRCSLWSPLRPCRGRGERGVHKSSFSCLTQCYEIGFDTLILPVVVALSQVDRRQHARWENVAGRDDNPLSYCLLMTFRGFEVSSNRNPHVTVPITYAKAPKIQDSTARKFYYR